VGGALVTACTVGGAATEEFSGGGLDERQAQRRQAGVGDRDGMGGRDAQAEDAEVDRGGDKVGCGSPTS
jgi:hypothetical protein